MTTEQRAQMAREIHAQYPDVPEPEVFYALRFVLIYAGEQSRRLRPHMALDVGDLEGEGRDGLLHAAARFDPNRGVVFSTYAVWWVKQRINRAIEQSTGIPQYRQSEIKKYEMFGELPRLTRGYKTAEATARKPWEDAPLCLDEIRSPGGTPWVETLQSADDPEEETLRRLEAAEQRCWYAGLLGCLTPREAQVLHLRIYHGWTFQQCADELALSREAIRQIEVRAVRKIRQKVAT